MRYIHFALYVLAAMMVACTADERDSEQQQNLNEAIILNINPDGMIVEPQTRGYSTTPAYNGGYTLLGVELVKVGVCGVSGSTRPATEEVKTFTASNAGALSITPATNKFYWQSGNEVISLRAWSYGTSDTPADIPTSGANLGKISFTILNDQSTSAEVKELLYCTEAQFDYSTYHNTNLTLNLHHQLARIVINVKLDNTGDAISGVTIGDGTNNTIPTVGTFTIPASGNLGTWTDQGTNVSSIAPYEWGSPYITSGYEKTYSAVMIPGTLAASTNFIKVTTASGSYCYQLSTALTLDPGKQYVYNVSVRNQQLIVTSSISDWGANVQETKQANAPIDIRRNPLWYVAENNVKSYNKGYKTVTLETDPATAGSSYTYSYSDAVGLFGANHSSASYDGYLNGDITDGTTSFHYHLPTQMEWLGIIPSASEASIFSASNPTPNTIITEPACTFGYNDDTRYGNGNSSNPNTPVGNEYKSYWDDYSTANVRYAIRFIGTNYCSVWKYQWDTDKLIVSSHLITTLNESDDLATVLASLPSKPDSYWSNDEAKGVVQRIFYAAGYCSTGSGTANLNQSVRGYFWSTTTGKAFGFTSGSVVFYSKDNQYGFSVRPFRNTSTYTQPSKAKTTVEAILAGVSDDYQVGDVVCQDGSIFRYDGATTALKQAKMEGRSPLGIIVYKCAASPTATDYKITEGMGHALVMGIDDVGSYAWSGSTEGTGFTDETCGSPDLFPNIAIGSYDDYKGLAKTNALANHVCNASHSHPAFEATKTWREQSAYQVGFTATEWFVPSVGQWAAALTSLVSSRSFTVPNGWSANAQDWTDISTVIKTHAGGNIEEDKYHTSSDNQFYSSKYYSLRIMFSSTAGNGVHFGNAEKTLNTVRVRPFFAF